MARARDDSGQSAVLEILLLLCGVACVFALCILPSPPPPVALNAKDRELNEWHCAGFMISASGLVLAYLDDVPVLISSGGRSIKLTGRLRWHTLGAQTYVLSTLVFLLHMMLDAGATHSRIVRGARVLLAVAYPTSLAMGIFYRLVLIPAYRRAGDRWAKLGLGGRPRPLILYNSSIVLLTGELVLSRVNIAWRDLPAMILFAVCYTSHHIDFVKKHGLCVYDYLDYRRPGALLRHASVLVGSCFVFALGPMASLLMLQPPFGELGSALFLLVGTLCFVPFFGPETKTATPVPGKAVVNADDAHKTKSGKID